MNKKIIDDNSQESKIKEILKILPRKTGIYIFKDHHDKIIYIGKAKNLSSRVKSYFQDNRTNIPYARPSDFAGKIKSIDYVVTDNETEALILEGNLIKKNKPKYNIELKDDKSYPFVAVTIGEKFPRVFLTRDRNIKDARYFGPYTDARAVRKTLEYLRKIFQVRDCKKTKPGKGVNVPCLNYHIKLCPAPCINNISPELYRKNIDFVILFLKGKDRTIIEKLKIKMDNYSKIKEFEKAAEIKKKIEDINKLYREQKIFFPGGSKWDFISIARGDGDSAISLFTYKSGMLAIINNFIVNNTGHLKDNEILSGFIEKYYTDIDDKPSKIFCPVDMADPVLISDWSSKKKSKKVDIIVPKIGEKKKIMEMAVRNSKLYLEKKKFEKDTGLGSVYKDLQKLKDIFGLTNLPERIECFDISNLKNSFPVGSMSVSLEGMMVTGEYRHFKIKYIKGQDDCRMINEVVARRLKYLKNGEIKRRETFYIKPDLIIIDGGKAQYNTIKRLLSEKNIDSIDIISIAKKEEVVFCDKYPEGLKLDLHDRYARILIKARDEAHRFAVNFHRRLRDKNMTGSMLDGIKGIGEKKKKYIYENISSLEDLKNKTIKDLTKIKGLNYKDADKIYKRIHR